MPDRAPAPSEFLEQAVQLALDSVAGGGGPFGALIIRDAQVIARGQNCVTGDFDPTAHAEIVAIRDACRKLCSWRLEGCILFCSCEPCPMCLGAILWSRLDAAYYAATRHDAAAAGFDDARFYEALAGSITGSTTSISQMRLASALDPFQTWAANENRIEY